ncbi:MAG: MMPL family transporter [Chitinivibrionales bacterium]|nr:MMPL family transporter [Chitinivibrionales bacterium]
MSDRSKSFIPRLIASRYAVIAVVAVLTMFFGYFLGKLKINNDPTRSVPEDLKEKVAYEKIQEKFPLPMNILVIAQFDSLSLQHKVDSIRSWANQLAEIEEIASVIHIANVQIPVKGGFFGLSSEYIASGTKELSEEQLRGRIRDNREFTAQLVSEDEHTFSILLTFDLKENKPRLMAKVHQLVDEFRNMRSARLYVTSQATLSYYINKLMRRDFSVLLPISLVLVFALLLWVFGRARYVFFSFLIIGISLVWTFGLMALLNIPFSIVSSIIPVILFPAGVADSIHVVRTYKALRIRHDSNCLNGLIDTYDELMRPIMLTTITTFIGFGSFIISPNKWTQEFGSFTAVAIFFALTLTIILLPILIYLKEHKADQGRKVTRRTPSFAGIWDWFYANLIAGKYWILILAITMIVAVYGFFKVRVESNPIAMFSPESELRTAEAIAEKGFGGTRFFTVMLTRISGPIETVDAWKQVSSIRNEISNIEEVRNVSSLLTLLTKTSELLKGKELTEAAIGMVLNSKGLFSKAFAGYVRSWITDDHTTTKLSVTCVNQSGVQYKRIAEEIERLVSEKYPGWEAVAAGPAVLTDAMVSVIIYTQISTLVVTLIVVLVVLSLLFKSIKLGITAVLPITLSTAFVYALMGVFGVDINTVTVIIVNTCIGIGIDYSIHFVAGFRFLSRTIDNRSQALLETLKNKGSVIVFNTLVVGFGFLVLSWSAFPPIREFGLFVFLSMLTSCAFSLIFLPIVLRAFRKI